MPSFPDGGRERFRCHPASSDDPRVPLGVSTLQVRLNEKEVTLFSGVPERLMILMHEEMYLAAVHLGMGRRGGWLVGWDPARVV